MNLGEPLRVKEMKAYSVAKEERKGRGPAPLKQKIGSKNAVSRGK